MMLPSNQKVIWLLLLPLSINAATVTYTVPPQSPSEAASLDPAPLGIS
jgi:hypothetical protein